MITAQELMGRMGKQKFHDFVLQKKDKEKTGHDRTRGIRGRIKFRQCHHGVWVIDNYEPKLCKDCHGTSVNNAPAVQIHSHEYFNIGTGTYGTNPEHRKYAKRMGLQEAG